jgi:hypothetical protein
LVTGASSRLGKQNDSSIKNSTIFVFPCIIISSRKKGIYPIYQIFTMYIHMKSCWELPISYGDPILNITKGPEADCNIAVLYIRIGQSFVSLIAFWIGITSTSAVMLFLPQKSSISCVSAIPPNLQPPSTRIVQVCGIPML